jgi:hypothetical protein
MRIPITAPRHLLLEHIYKLESVICKATRKLEKLSESPGVSDSSSLEIGDIQALLEFKCPVCGYPEPHHESECPDK